MCVNELDKIRFKLDILEESMKFNSKRQRLKTDLFVQTAFDWFRCVKKLVPDEMAFDMLDMYNKYLDEYKAKSDKLSVEHSSRIKEICSKYDLNAVL